jgi:hypothetical protein
MNDNKCHCQAPAPWLVTIRVVKYDYGHGDTITEVSTPMDRVHYAACDEHLAGAIRDSLTRAPDKMENSYLISVRGPDDA